MPLIQAMLPSLFQYSRSYAVKRVKRSKKDIGLYRPIQAHILESCGECRKLEPLQA
jgi:hypothetical protein